MNEIPHRVHLVGLAGVHLSGIARVLAAWGHDVSGSDMRLSAVGRVYRNADGRPNVCLCCRHARQDDNERPDRIDAGARRALAHLPGGR